MEQKQKNDDYKEMKTQLENLEKRKNVQKARRTENKKRNEKQLNETNLLKVEDQTWEIV